MSTHTSPRPSSSHPRHGPTHSQSSIGSQPSSTGLIQVQQQLGEDPVSQRRLVNESCLDYLLSEMVHLIQDATAGADEDKETAYVKLESLGYRVGHVITERITRDRPRFNDSLEVIKFVCKDLWTFIFKKQIDNLKTNHRGIYVLQDNSFRWFSRMSTPLGGSDAARRATPYLWFPCGLVRGALASLGVISVVIAETSGLPQCTFQIKITPKQ